MDINTTPHPSHPSRRSNSSQSTSLSHTPPGSWAVSGKLVRKKASGLFRDAARSWGRSKSKEVLALGLGALIGSSPQPELPPSPSIQTTLDLNPSAPLPLPSPALTQPLPNSNPTNLNSKPFKKRISLQPGSKKFRAKDSASTAATRRSEIGFGDWADTLNTAVASSSPTSPMSPSRHEHECQSHPLLDLDSNMVLPSSNPHNRPRRTPLAGAFDAPTGTLDSSQTLASSVARRRDRSAGHTRHSTMASSSEVEPVSSTASVRIPRSTFPHPPRSPRSPRRTYQTRAAALRSSTSALQSQHETPPLNPSLIATPHAYTNAKATPCDQERDGLNQYQQPAPMTSSPFKRSVSPISHFNSHYDIESPVASKSTGYGSLPSFSQPSPYHVVPTPLVLNAHPLAPMPSKLRPLNASGSLRLPSGSSARANLFGAKPNQSGSFDEPFSAPSHSTEFSRNDTASGLLGATGRRDPSIPQTLQLQSWNDTPMLISPPGSPLHATPSHRTRPRTASLTAKDHPSRQSSYGLGPLPEDEHGSDNETDLLAAHMSFNQSSPSSRSCNGMVRINGSGSPIALPTRRASAGSVKGCSTLSRREHSSGSSSRLTPRNLRERDTSVDCGLGSQREELDMTTRRRSLIDSGEDDDYDERVTQAPSSKPSSSHSIMSLKTSSLDPFSTYTSVSSHTFLKSPGLSFDGFGALPPPESPFPGHHRQPPIPTRSSAIPASPNKLKRDNAGAPLTSTPHPPTHRHRSALHPPSSHNLRSRADSSKPYHRRDSWGHRSVDVSEEDDEDNDLVRQHDRDGLNGSHESHEALSNLSIPGLTDSSSLASSLASSHQSSSQPHVGGAPYRSTSWEKSSPESGRDAKRRSLPTDVGRTSPHSYTHLPPCPFSPLGTPSHHSSSFFAQPPVTPLPEPASFISSSMVDQESGLFHDIKPEASAFLSATMASKKDVALERRRQQLGMPSPFAKYALHAPSSDRSLSSSLEDSIALRSMRQALGGARVVAAAVRVDDEQQRQQLEHLQQSSSFHGASNQSISFDSTSSPFISAEMFARRPSLSSLRMPDTPIKRPTFLNKKASHLQHNRPFVSSGLSKPVNAAFNSPDDGSPLDESPSSRSLQHHAAHSSQSPRPLEDVSQRSHRATPLMGEGAFDSPLGCNRIARHGSPILASPSGLLNFKKSPLFRRRSHDSVVASRSGSDGESRTSRVIHMSDDPGTPTKVAPGWIARSSQLLISPCHSISSGASSPVLSPFPAHPKISTHDRQTPDFLKDPQVTPSRPTGRIFTSFAASSAAFQPLASSSQLFNSRSFSPPCRPPFTTRHSSAETRAKNQAAVVASVSTNKFETEFDVVETIGNGEFGEVFKARHSSNGAVYAIKRAKRPVGGPKATSRQMEEVEALKRLTLGANRSPYIIQLHDAWQHNYYLHIQTEYCPNGSLQDFLELTSTLMPRLDEVRIWKIITELAQAVCFIHAAGILHLDLKPANVFVTAYGGLKVGDFGLALRWPRIDARQAQRDPAGGLVSGRYPIYYYAPTPLDVPEETAAIPARFLRYVDIRDADERQWMRLKPCGRFVGFDLEREGDREYIAPETLSGRYGDPADVFAIGLIALEMVTGVMLPDNGDQWRGLRSSDFSTLDLSGVSAELVVVIKRMMDRDPDRRVGSDQLVRHPVLLKLAELRARGLENEEIFEDGDLVNAEGGEEMEDSEIPSMAKPKAPEDGIWNSARGAILPEAEGFLQFVFTGEATPQRPRRSVMRRRGSDEMDVDC